MDLPSYLVRITGESDTGEAFDGTGFFVDIKGRVATCRHVVIHHGNPPRKIQVYVHAYSDPWDYRIRDTSTDDDLALLEGIVPPTIATEAANLHTVWFDDAAVGQELAIYGHSSAGNYPAGQRYPCTISSFSEKDGRVGVIGEINPGDSGGPVVNKENKVIGIVHARDRVRSGQARFIPISLLIQLLRKNQILFPEPKPKTGSSYIPNPFTWRGGITDPGAFFNREDEQLRIRDFLYTRQNCQIVGPRRIGKSSLLLQIRRTIGEWQEEAVLAYVDLQDPRCHRLSDWLDHVSQRFSWVPKAATMADFARRVEASTSRDEFLVLCLDEFEEFTLHSDEFSPDFFKNLRAAGQMGMAIITASRKPLNELTDPNDETSRFYNIFSLIELSGFSAQDVDQFLSASRPNVPNFDAEERRAIAEFANGRPLALQVACFHVLAAKRKGEPISLALKKASSELKAYA